MLEVKEHIALAILSGEHTAAEAAREYEVSASLIRTWRAQFLEAGRAHLQGAKPDAAQKKSGRSSSLRLLFRTRNSRFSSQENPGSRSVDGLLSCCQELPRDHPKLSLSKFAGEVGRPYCVLRGARQKALCSVQCTEQCQHILEAVRFKALEELLSNYRPVCQALQQDA
ncbi:helix-turn-helix domain-containing protein [Deinococcus proteolyticus]|uniref:helix-turn-helix domain-containing protein n=1 Tax=Deinococcus proteolyticus TaxID=55148 RepID=UPI001C54EE83